MDGDLRLEVTAPSLGGGRREKIQEEGWDMNLKNRLLASSRREWRDGIWAQPKLQSDNIWHTDSNWKDDTENAAL